MAFELRYLCPLLEIFDMPASLRFYRDVLGFEIVETAPPAGQVAEDKLGWAWLRRDGTDLMLNTAYDPDDVRPPAPEAARVSAHGDTALFIGCPDVDAVYRHLRDHGQAVEAPMVTSYGMKQVYVKDPDGFTICFQWAAETPGAGTSRQEQESR